MANYEKLWLPPEESSRFEAHPDTQETDVFKTTFALEVPILTAASNVYGKTHKNKYGWHLCGPTSYLLGNFLNAVTGVPIHQEPKDQEHIEYIYSIYNPKDPADQWKYNDHIFPAYFPGKKDPGSEAFTVDTVGTWLNNEASKLEGTFDIAVHPAWDIRHELKKSYSYYPFSEKLAAKAGVTILEQKPPTKEDYENFMGYIHSEAIFSNRFRTHRNTELDWHDYFGDVLRKAAGEVIQITEQALANQQGRIRPLPANLSPGEFLDRLKSVPHIIPSGY